MLDRFESTLQDHHSYSAVDLQTITCLQTVYVKQRFPYSTQTAYQDKTYRRPSPCLLPKYVLRTMEAHPHCFQVQKCLHEMLRIYQRISSDLASNIRKNLVPWSNWLWHLVNTEKVPGSIPGGTSLFGPSRSKEKGCECLPFAPSSFESA